MEINNITDSDFIKCVHLNDEEYQVVYSVLYFYGDEDYSELADLYVYNHIIQLVKRQENPLLGRIKIKQWIYIINQIIKNLEGKQSCKVYVPFLTYCYDVEETLMQYNYLLTILSEIVQYDIDDLECIEDERLDEIYLIPAISELINGLANAIGLIQLPREKSELLKKELLQFYTIDDKENYTVDEESLLSHIKSLYSKQMESEEDEWAINDFKKGYDNCDSIGSAGYSFSENIQILFENFVLQYVLFFKSLGIEEYVGFEEIIREELFRRELTADEEVKTQWYDLSLYKKTFIERDYLDVLKNNLENLVSNEEETFLEENVILKKKDDSLVKRVAVLYYLLKDSPCSHNVTEFAKIVCCILGIEIKGKVKGTTVYTYINKPEERLLTVSDYVIEKLKQYELPVPEVLKPKKINKLR